MKTPLLTSVSLGLALVALPLVGGCSQQNANGSPSFLSSANAEPASAGDNPPAVSSASANLSATATLGTSAAQPAPAVERKLPPNINPSTPAGQVIKLAQAGVDETVMLTYITNTGSLFTLGSDEIIYLNDIGVPSNVVTAMLNHDQSVKEFWSNNANAQASTAPVQAAAPAYVNPPQPEPQPVTVDVAAAPAQPANATYNYFDDSLSPYGSWIEVEGYGRCWQPTVVVANRGWQPYSDRGRWVYSDAGWYWYSDYSWGATTFHYGRWFNNARFGWCWWPDTVWAPSWVSWRYSGDYCGWAPLPPRACYQSGFGFSYYDRSVGFSFDFGLGASSFTFVPWGRFCDSRPYHYRVPSQQVTQIYNNTTVINNYASGNNNTVINQGIPLDRVRAHTRADLEPVRLREAGATASHGTRGERLDHDGRTLTVHRPQVSASGQVAASTAPRSRADNTPRNNTAAGAGAAVLTETTRGHGRDRNAEETRERGGRPSASTTTVVGAPVQNRNAAATATVTAPPANPGRQENRATPRARDERPDNANRERKRDNGQNSTPAPLIVNGSDNRTASPAPVTQPAPKGSLVVIGRRNDNQSAPARTTQTWSAPATATQPAQVAAAPQIQSAPTRSYNPPANQPSRVERREAPRVTREENRYVSPPSAPSYNAPRSPSYSPPAASPAYSAPHYAPAPSYSAPRQPAYSPPAAAPSYSAPHSAPAPSYSPPPAPASRPQNVESRSAPDRSQSNRDGDRGNGRNR